ncbi:hypothetical protein TcasGA2_TC004771 [Tribolium castaneum]|uniref:Uncharacterized protein n=1 Tax=Tribolium castaneum TaxID=7070 RepID=D6W810_TRICA|nr:hypothetical protein TcasGA2_TC004771 [Tribolium castaneum]
MGNVPLADQRNAPKNHSNCKFLAPKIRIRKQRTSVITCVVVVSADDLARERRRGGVPVCGQIRRRRRDAHFRRLSRANTVPGEWPGSGSGGFNTRSAVLVAVRRVHFTHHQIFRFRF